MVQLYLTIQNIPAMFNSHALNIYYVQGSVTQGPQMNNSWPWP